MAAEARDVPPEPPAEIIPWMGFVRSARRESTRAVVQVIVWEIMSPRERARTSEVVREEEEGACLRTEDWGIVMNGWETEARPQSIKVTVVGVVDGDAEERIKERRWRSSSSFVSQVPSKTI